MASFRFWIGRSTIDALMNLKRWPVGMTSQGETLLAVFLDIANAFNGLLLGVYGRHSYTSECPCTCAGCCKTIFMTGRFSTQIVGASWSGARLGVRIGVLLWN